MISSTFLRRLLLIACVCGAPAAAAAQEPYFPLDHLAPPGTAGRWNAILKPASAGVLQPVRVSLPTAGSVTFYQGSPHSQAALSSPAQVGMMVGYVYRCRVADMPEFPGVELFPTIEILDRLHPPAELVDQYPIPVEITAEEIFIALQDRMVTKVIYLEQPDLAKPQRQEGGIRTEDLPPGENLLKAADFLGRPMAIVRLGGRIPDPTGPTDEFHSTSPLHIPAAAAP